MVNRLAIVIQIGLATHLTVGEMAEIFGAPIGLVHELVLDLEVSGLVFRSHHGRGKYMLTVEGWKMRSDARRSFEEITRSRRGCL